MFLLGVLVGRGSLPLKFKINPLKGELTRLQQADQEKELERIQAAADAAKEPSDMAFYEELKKTTPPASTVKAKPKAEAKKPAPPARSKVVRKKVKPPETVSSKTQQRSGAKKPFTIQAASIKDFKDAEKLVADLKAKNFAAYKTIGIVPDKGIWFRVRVGRYEDKDEAAETIERLKKEGFEPLLIRVQD